MTSILRLPARLTTAAAVGVVVLLMCGIHGVVAVFVRQRFRDLAIRVALGATPATIVVLAAATIVRPAILGFCCGCLLLAALGGAVAPVFLAGPVLQVHYLAVSLVLLLGALTIAVAVPARRLVAIQPGQILKE